MSTLGRPSDTTVAQPRHRAALAAALVSVVLWSSAFVGIRAADGHFAPAPLAAARLLIGSIALGLIVVARREPLPSRRELPAIIVCGLLWFALYNVALNSGERFVDAGVASLITGIGPILVAVLAGIFLGEGFSTYVFAGGAVAIVGTAVMAATGGSHANLRGVVLCLLAVVAYAGGVVTEKVVLRHVSVLQTVFLCCLVGAVACSPALPAFVHETATAPAGKIAWVAYLGVFPTAVGFTTWAYTLARTEAARLGTLIYLGPPVSIGLAWWLLAEVPPSLALLGGAVCLLGVSVSRRPARSGPSRVRDPKL
jgi:drug/metabolite transporter (DMT)-like permease